MDRRAEQGQQQQGQQTTDVAREQGRRVGDTASEEGRRLAEEARDRMGNVLDESKQQVRHEADKQMRTAARTLEDTGRQMEEMAQQADGVVASVARGMGGEIRKFGERVEQRGMQGVMDDVSRFARQRPGTFLLGAGLAGFVAGRLIRNVGSESSGAQGGSLPAHSGPQLGDREEQAGYRTVSTEHPDRIEAPERRAAP